VDIMFIYMNALSYDGDSRLVFGSISEVLRLLNTLFGVICCEYVEVGC
jgi:hypothetical protein